MINILGGNILLCPNSLLWFIDIHDTWWMSTNCLFWSKTPGGICLFVCLCVCNPWAYADNWANADDQCFNFVWDLLNIGDLWRLRAQTEQTFRGRPLIIWVGGGAYFCEQNFFPRRPSEKIKLIKLIRGCQKKNFVCENPDHGCQMINGRPLTKRSYTWSCLCVQFKLECKKL